MHFFKTVTKNIAITSSFLGLYYLFVFTYKEGIPFPLDLAILPTVLIALGMLCLLFTFIAILYSSISVIVISDPIEIGYSKLIVSKPYWIKSEIFANVFNFIIFFCATPIILLFSSAIDYKHTTWIFYLSLFITPLLFVYYAFTPDTTLKEDKLKTLKTAIFWKSYFTFFYIGFFAVLSIFIYIKYLEFGLVIKTEMEYLTSISIFFILSFFILRPPRKKNWFQKNAQNHSKSSLPKDFLRVPAFYVYSLSLLFTLIPSIAYSTAAASFKFLSVGGGIERSYYFTKTARVTVPPELIDKCDSEGYCHTKSLNVVFDLGGVLYVSGEYFGNNNTLISLPKSNLYMVSQNGNAIDNASKAIPSSAEQ